MHMQMHMHMCMLHVVSRSAAESTYQQHVHVQQSQRKERLGHGRAGSVKVGLGKVIAVVDLKGVGAPSAPQRGEGARGGRRG